MTKPLPADIALARKCLAFVRLPDIMRGEMLSTCMAISERDVDLILDHWDDIPWNDPPEAFVYAARAALWTVGLSWLAMPNRDLLLDCAQADVDAAIERLDVVLDQHSTGRDPQASTDWEPLRRLYRGEDVSGDGRALPSLRRRKDPQEGTMRIIVIGGAAGTIGRPLADRLAEKHEVVRVGRTTGDYEFEMSSPESIRELFRAVGPFDAVVSAAGRAQFKGLFDLTDGDFEFSLANKLMGQVNLVRYGVEHMHDGGSFTLTSGVLSQEPAPGSAAISLVNAGLEGFVRAAALEMPRGIRVNVVSPPWVSETLAAMGKDYADGMPADLVANAYIESIEGSGTGETLDARLFGRGA